LLWKADWHCVAALLLCAATLPASPGRYLAETAAIADRDPLLPKTDKVVLVATTAFARAPQNQASPADVLLDV
jgi:hypothetical protein